MNNDTFSEKIGEWLEHIHDTLQCKGAEYAKDDDRLHNFHQAAAIMRTTPEKALLGMLAKHLVSVIDEIQKPTRAWASAGWRDEKIGDCICYLLLLACLWEEKAEKEGK
jgi:hypothetical protein